MKKQGGSQYNKLAVFVAILLLGAVAYHWLLPNLVTVTTTERNLPVERVEAINMAGASFIQSHGWVEAEQAWKQAEGSQERYELLSPFLAFAPKDFVDYMPDGHSIELWATLRPLRKARLLRKRFWTDAEEIVY